MSKSRWAEVLHSYQSVCVYHIALVAVDFKVRLKGNILWTSREFMTCSQTKASTKIYQNSSAFALPIAQQARVYHPTSICIQVALQFAGQLNRSLERQLSLHYAGYLRRHADLLPAASIKS